MKTNEKNAGEICRHNPGYVIYFFQIQKGCSTMGNTPTNTTLTQTRRNTNINANQNINQNIDQNAVMQSTLWEQDAQGPQSLSAWDSAEGIVKEFNEDQSVGLKSGIRRKMVQKTKRAYYAEANEKIDHQNQQAQGNNQANLPAAGNQQVTVAEIRRLLTKRVDFMAYKDDKAFLELYDDVYSILSSLDATNTRLATMTAQEYATLKGQYGEGLPPLEELKEKGKMFSDQKKHYEYKLKLISNPFYTVLQNRDTASMKIDDLKAQRDKCRADHRDKLADYLDATINLRELAEKGASREIDKSNLVTGFRKDLAGGVLKHHKGYFEAGTVDLHYGSTKAHLGASGVGEAAKADLDRRKIYGEETRPLDDVGIGAEVNASLKAKAAKGSYKYKNSFFDFGVNASVGAAAVKGGIGAKAGYNSEEGVHGILKADIRGEGQALKGRIKAGLHFRDWVGVGVKAKAKAGEVWADASAKFGKFKLNEESEANAYGLYAKGSFGASLASLVTNGTLNIKGVKISLGLTGQIGAVGGEASGYLTTGGIGGSLGFLAGLGFNIKLDIDYSVITDWLISKLFTKR